MDASSDVHAAKQQARRIARALRNAHQNDPRPGFLELVCDSPYWNRAKTIALTVPFGVEPPTGDIIAAAQATGRTIVLPHWIPDAPGTPAPHADGGVYQWAEFSGMDRLSPGLLGIPEPDGKTVPASTIDLFLIPGLLFDHHGTRLGHGRGFIDRLLAGRSPSAIVAGLAFSWQISPTPLPAEPHDVRMDTLFIR
ncbi:MAG: 5-formyltetrahydrofolate cyclo-ligase [Kiritimatiellia bacterium]